MSWVRWLGKSRRGHLREFRRKLEEEIAEKRQIEKELAHLASFPEWDPNCIIETDLSGNFKYTNPAGHQEFPELATLKLRHPLMDGLDTVVDQLRRDKKTVAKRILKLKDRIYEQQVSVFEEYARVRIYMVDITELKKLDQLKTDFVNTVSHELRTPLTAVQATVKMVFAGVLGDLSREQRDALSLALQNIDRLGRMINDLLDLSKIEVGKFELHREWVDAASLVDGVGRSFQALARQKGLRMEVHVSQNPLMIFIDRDKITQVIANLVHNALKFTQKGSISLSVLERENGLQFEIADTGRGIAPEDLPRLFRKFQQFGAAPSPEEKGTGLGLSLCKALVDLHRGNIRVESALGRGARFILILPRLDAVELFKENVQNCLHQATEEGRSVSLINFSTKTGEADPLTRLESVARRMLRTSSDWLVRTSSALWILLLSEDKASATRIGERILEEFSKDAGGRQDEPAVEIRLKTAGYPEDGHLVEKLLTLLE